MTFSIIIPTRNERNNLEQLLPVLIKLYPDSPVWIVDDDSEDQTSEFVKSFSHKYPLFHLLSRKNKMGRGSAVLDGLKEAFKDDKISYFLEMDADLSHDPREIEKLLDEIKTGGTNEDYNYVGDASQYKKQPKIPILKTELNASIDRLSLGGDTWWQIQRNRIRAGVSEKFGIEAAIDEKIIIGSRHIRGGKFVNCSPFRVFLSKLANFYARLILGVPINDYTNGFRLYPKEAIKLLINSKIHEKGYITLSETAYILHKHGFNFTEVPTIFINRKVGKSNATILEFLRSIPAIFRIRNHHNYHN